MTTNAKIKKIRYDIAVSMLLHATSCLKYKLSDCEKV